MQLTEKYRPKRLADLIGQQPVVDRLRRYIDRGIGGRVFLFQGPSGVGKTSAAMALAREIDIVRDDETLQDIMAGRVLAGVSFLKASECDKGAAEDMHYNMFYAPVRGRFKMTIIDEAQAITKGAMNAMLNIFESIPDHCVVILTTTEESLGEELFGWRSPFGSRCKRIEFDPLTSPEARAQIAEHLATIAWSETGDGANIPYADIVRTGRSNLRACIQLLEDYL